MKKLGKLKLNQLSKAELEKKGMGMIKGGGPCSQQCSCDCTNNCACAYANPQQCDTGDDTWGGSSSDDNSNANMNNLGNNLVSSAPVQTF